MSQESQESQESQDKVAILRTMIDACTCYKPSHNGCDTKCLICLDPDEWEKPVSRCPWSCECSRCNRGDVADCPKDGKCQYYLCSQASCTCYKPWMKGCYKKCRVCDDGDEWEKETSKCPWSCTCDAGCNSGDIRDCGFGDCPYMVCQVGKQEEPDL